MKENNKENFLKGAAILGFAGIVVKILGAVFRIPIVWIITSVGLGYYQTAYPIYVLLVAIATSGFPVAISKMVSERRALGNFQGAEKVFRLVFKILLGFGIIASVTIFFGAKFIVGAKLHNPKAYWAMIALTPAILLVPIMAAFRGYFQGHNNMRPSAISQILEQFARVIFGVGLAILLVPRGLEYGAAGATFGASAGAVVGLCFMLAVYLKNRRKFDSEVSDRIAFEEEGNIKILKELITIALPIIIGALVMPIMNMIDLALVMGRLEAAGFTNDQANSMYAQLTGMAATLINLPQVVTSAIAISLVPVISSAYAVKNMDKVKYNTNLAIRVSILIGLPAGVGLFVLSTPIIKMLFPNEPASVGIVLAIMSVGVVFLSVIQSFTSVLQGMGKAHIPVLNLFIGAGVKFALTYVLTGLPWLNVRGAAISTVSAYFVAAILDFLAVKKMVGIKFDLKQFVIGPLMTAGVMGAFAWGTYQLSMLVVGRNSISTLLGVLVGAIVYGVTLFRTGTIIPEELESMPKGDRIVSKLRKLRLIK